jgi:hypothetical protein
VKEGSILRTGEFFSEALRFFLVGLNRLGVFDQ